MWIGRDRAAVARALLAAHPSCDAIVSDDGLQHYRLARDFEIAVIDGARGLGNGLMLPSGPLRSRPPGCERSMRSSSTALRIPPRDSGWFTMGLEGHQFRNLLNPGHSVEADHFQRQRVCAIAESATRRVFSHLNTLGLSFEGQPFRDHYDYVERDLDPIDADAIVMTERMR